MAEPIDMSAFVPELKDGRPLLDDGTRYSAAMQLGHLVEALAALPDGQRREVIGQALGITGLGGFECDPRDSAELLALRQAIDEELGWHTAEEEEAADYVANVKRMAEDLVEFDNARREEKARADRAEYWLGLAETFLAGLGDIEQWQKLKAELEAKGRP